MKIRPAQLDDALPMARVIVDTFLTANQGVMSEEALQRRREEWTHEVSARNWSRAIQAINDGVAPLECIYVAEDEQGEVVGLAAGCPSGDETPLIDTGETDVGEVSALYVRESNQGQGIGRALVQVTATHLACVGMKKLHICTAAANVKGRAFYEKIGGVVVGTRDDYGDGELLVLVVYEWPDIHVFTSLDSPDHP